MPDERPMQDAMEPRDVERGKPKKVLRDDEPAESALPTADADEAVRPKQMN